MNRRVFVQGSGAICGFGAGRERLFQGVFAGDSALRPLVRLSGDTKVAAEVPPASANAEYLARRVMEECGRGDAIVLATTKADLNRILALIEEIPAEDRSLADALADLAEDFEYGRIRTWMEKAGG